MRGHRPARLVKFLLFGAVAATVLSGVVMTLWNWLMPAIFGWRAVTFWQAVGLLVLSRILFGRFGKSGGRGRWRHRMKERWNQMTPEEREKFKAGMAARCGRFEPPVTGPAA